MNLSLQIKLVSFRTTKSEPTQLDNEEVSNKHKQYINIA